MAAGKGTGFHKLGFVRRGEDERFAVFAGEKRVGNWMISELLFVRIEPQQRSERQLGFFQVHIVFGEVPAGSLERSCWTTALIARCHRSGM